MRREAPPIDDDQLADPRAEDALDQVVARVLIEQASAELRRLGYGQVDAAIVEGLSEGKSRAEIAAECDVAPSTVDAHLRGLTGWLAGWLAKV